MTGHAGRSARARDLGYGALCCASAATLLVTCGAGAVALSGLADDVRRALRFDFAGVEQTPAAALQIALQNARLVAAVLLCAAVVAQRPQPARPVADVALTIVLAFNAGLIGAALGAYGARLAIATALHLPLELGALCFAGGAYMHARRQPLGRGELAAVAATCSLLLVIAATLETYVRLGGVG
jgi:hypothetical protein